MAKRISSKDIFEQEDIFKGIRDSAKLTIEQMKNLAKAHLDLVACRDALLPMLMSGEISVS